MRWELVRFSDCWHFEKLSVPMLARDLKGILYPLPVCMNGPQVPAQRLRHVHPFVVDFQFAIHLHAAPVGIGPAVRPTPGRRKP